MTLACLQIPANSTASRSTKLAHPKRSAVERRPQIAQILPYPICQWPLCDEILDRDPAVVADLAKSGEELRQDGQRYN